MHRIPGLRARRFGLAVWTVPMAAFLVLSSTVKGQTPPVAPSAPPSAPQSSPDISRDLKPVHPGDKAKPIVPGAVPQSYALVVGISNYENLPATAQLHYPGRDAQSIYTTLISEQGGEFP